MTDRVIALWRDALTGTLLYVMGSNGVLWVAGSLTGNLEELPKLINQDGWEWNVLATITEWDESKLDI